MHSNPQTTNEGLTPEQKIDVEVSAQVSRIAHAAWDKAKLGNTSEDAQAIYGREMLNALWSFVNADRQHGGESLRLLSEQYKSLWNVAKQMADALKQRHSDLSGVKSFPMEVKALASWRNVGRE